MDLRLTFDEDAQNYDRARPGYPAELYDAVFAYSGAGPGARVLEIGPGTGQATAPFLEKGCRVTAVELGAQLSRYGAKVCRPPGDSGAAGGFSAVSPAAGVFRSGLLRHRFSLAAAAAGVPQASRASA